MTINDRLGTWERKILTGVFGVISLAAISYGGWSTVAIVDRPTREEVRTLIKTDAPFVAQAPKIDFAITSLKEEKQELLTIMKEQTSAMTRVVEKNTEAIRSIETQMAESRVQMQTLTKILERLSNE